MHNKNIPKGRRKRRREKRKIVDIFGRGPPIKK